MYLGSCCMDHAPVDTSKSFHHGHTLNNTKNSHLLPAGPSSGPIPLVHPKPTQQPSHTRWNAEPPPRAALWYPLPRPSSPPIPEPSQYHHRPSTLDLPNLPHVPAQEPPHHAHQPSMTHEKELRSKNNQVDPHPGSDSELSLRNIAHLPQNLDAAYPAAAPASLAQAPSAKAAAPLAFAECRAGEPARPPPRDHQAALGALLAAAVAAPTHVLARALQVVTHPDSAPTTASPHRPEGLQVASATHGDVPSSVVGVL